MEVSSIISYTTPTPKTTWNWKLGTFQFLATPTTICGSPEEKMTSHASKRLNRASSSNKTIAGH